MDKLKEIDEWFNRANVGYDKSNLSEEEKKNRFMNAKQYMISFR